MKKGLLILIFSQLAITLLIAQDSISIMSSFDIDLGSRHTLSAINSNDDCINCNFKLTDNPINHFAIYSNINSNINLNNKYHFKIGLLLEQRGFSFGNHTQRNLISIPWIKINTIDTFQIFKKNIKHTLVGGDLWNEEVNDVIRFHNLDYQGVYAKIGYKKIWLGYFVIADLSNSIGLEMDELQRLSLEFKNAGFTNVTSFNYNILSDQIHIEPNDIVLSNFTQKKIGNITLTGQLDMRINKSIQTSFASSLIFEYQAERFFIKSSIRYYDKNYNEGYKNTSVNYRGNQIYPLKNYFRSINQWALFTNQQNSSLTNFELIIQRRIMLTEKILLNANLDSNLLYNLTQNKLLIYPAYEILFNFHYLKNLKFEIGITNKHMELRSHYQTSTLSKLPFVTYGFKMDLKGIRKSEGNINVKDYH